MDTVLLSFGGYAFTVPALASLVAGALAVVLGVSVLLRERQSAESLQFLFFSLVLSVWMVSFGLMFAAPSAERALHWMHTGYLAIPFVPAAVYGFTVRILGSNSRRRMVMGTLWVAAALLVVLAVGGSAFDRGMTRYGWGWIHQLAPRAVVLIAYLVAGVGASLAEYVVAIRGEERPDRRRHLLLLLTAFGIGGLSMIDFLPSFGVPLPPVGYLPVLVGLLLLARVVQDHRLVELTPSFTADAILRTITDPVVVVDDRERVRFASEAVRESFGWAPDRLHGESWERLVTDEGQRAAVRELIASGEASDAEVVFATRDGEEVPTAVFASPVTDGSGDRVGTVLVIRDLRLRKAARRARERAETKYARLFELNPLAIGVATLDGREFLEVNESFERFFGISREEAVGQSPTELGIWVDPADRERVVEKVQDGEAVDGMEVEMRGSGGEGRDVLFFADAVELEGTSALLAMAYDITERKAFQEEMRRRALYDSLTELPNRSLLRDRLGHALERAERHGRSVSALVVDLDRFKMVNDSMGHAAGDEVLRQTADRLRSIVRDEDTVARMGGDEFVVVLEAIESPEYAVEVARRIKEALEAPFSVEGEDVHLSASTGIATSEAAEETAGELLRRSDVAMYRAKRDYTDTGYHVFNPERDTWATRRLQQENELRRAIEEDELVVHYQPVVHLERGQTVGVEALVRWNHPERGMVPPSEFIPLAEETGLVVALGDWVTRTATREAVGWRGNGGPPEGLHLGLNVSAAQVRDSGAVDRLREVLEGSGMPSSRLILEITESAAIGNREAVQELRGIGIRVAMDDLGTGYASLEFLTRLDVDVMKVDRTFVSGIGEDRRDEAIVEAAALIASRLETSLVAEGIETEAQLARVRELGYDYGQGFYFAKPMPAAELEALLQEGVSWPPGGGGS